MGLTAHSTGVRALDRCGRIEKRSPNERAVILAGNPNVGKSTVFNGLTGMKQHTGNWPGKTVSLAVGRSVGDSADLLLLDIPGTYSLLACSPDEEVARDALCFGDADAVTVVCDATCLERNLILVLQIMEITKNVTVCVNLMDEARRKGIHVSTDRLSDTLGVPVVGISARSRTDLKTLRRAMMRSNDGSEPLRIRYPDAIEAAVGELEAVLSKKALRNLSARWLALTLLRNDPHLESEIAAYLGKPLESDAELSECRTAVRQRLLEEGLDDERIKDLTVRALVEKSSELAKQCVTSEGQSYGRLDRRLDRILTGRLTGYPIMLLLLLFVFFLTISASNLPSAWLSKAFETLHAVLTRAFVQMDAPDWLRGLLLDGMLRTLGWVIAVMLPPMAIFFPLFTLLEDSGYLPRIAYNLDAPFQRCHACGKQALTMCMGFGCNAAGVVGCRIINSPRERLLAILTNAFVPCNGRFPALISLISVFLIGSASGMFGTLLSSVILTLIILLSVLITFGVTRLLSVTLLRGLPSAFTLELPPYRPPQIGRVILRSILDRTVYVLGRAVAVAAPAGLVIWVMANVTVGGASLLTLCADALDPLATLMGVDGIILMAFILGLPANEIVIPIMLMAYTSSGSLIEVGSTVQLRALLEANGWTWTTALSVILLFLMHAPCSTTLLTVKKETGSWKWTLVAAALPILLGILLCMAVTAIFTFIGI